MVASGLVQVLLYFFNHLLITSVFAFNGLSFFEKLVEVLSLGGGWSGGEGVGYFGASVLRGSSLESMNSPFSDCFRIAQSIMWYFI